MTVEHQIHLIIGMVPPAHQPVVETCLRQLVASVAHDVKEIAVKTMQDILPSCVPFLQDKLQEQADEENEVCAKIAESEGKVWDIGAPPPGVRIAAKIRARRKAK